MSSKEVQSAVWRFASRNGGIDFVSDPSSTHFSDAPIPKLVREMVQNSLDAKDDGFDDPVVVEFSEMSIIPILIGGESLEPHIAACFDRAASDGRAGAMAVYKRALETVRQRHIRCLKVQDTGTVALDDTRWNALVTQEGAVSKLGAAPGGSYGIGKNAALNVSDLQTVFYSTRYVAGRKGRVERMQGKATLMGHEAPDDSGDDLQHIGFYEKPNGSPLEGREIPEFFRLGETGTGVFVMGFNPRSGNWASEVTAAVIANYFSAIAARKLVVKIAKAGESEPSTEIDHQTIDSLFGRQRRPSDANFYYRAFRDVEPMHTDHLGLLGPLSVSVLIEDAAPRRVALVNRNGMLIADTKDIRINPISPRARGVWPDFAVVVAPATEQGDNWLRSMENPSHDSLSTAHLPTERERKNADELFKRAREAVAAIIEEKAALHDYEEVSNLEELAPTLADSGEGANQALEIKEHQPRESGWVDELDDTDDDTQSDDDPLDDDEQEYDDNHDNHDDDDDDDEDDDKERPPPVRRPRVRLRNSRVIPVSGTEAVVAFDSSEDSNREITLALALTGVERDSRLRDNLNVVEAYPLAGVDGEVTVEDGQITFTAKSGARLSLRVVVDQDIERAALSLGAK